MRHLVSSHLPNGPAQRGSKHSEDQVKNSASRHKPALRSGGKRTLALWLALSEGQIKCRDIILEGSMIAASIARVSSHPSSDLQKLSYWRFNARHSTSSASRHNSITAKHCP